MDLDRDFKSLIVRIVRDEVRWMRHYLAQVVDNKDTLSKGRVKVIIPELGFDTAEQGMWCFPRQGNSLSVPLQDEYVEIYFVAGDPNRPVYLHYATEANDKLKNYSSPKDRIIFESPETGEYIKYNEENKTLKMSITILNLLAQNGTLKVEMNETGTKLTTGDASAWAPCIIGNCIFSGAPHGGTPAGITKLTGG